jgi:uncharacterized protein (TIGR02246 family)
LVAVLLLAPIGCTQVATSPAQPVAVAPPPAPQPTLPAAPEPPPAPPPEEEPPAVAERWAAAYSKGDLNALMRLYDEDARLWGTSSSRIRKGSRAIREYYTQVLQAFPGARLTLGETSPRRYGDAGVNSGSYTLRRVSGNGTVTVTSARFTMTYVRRGGKWLIVDQHSSLAAR